MSKRKDREQREARQALDRLKKSNNFTELLAWWDYYLETDTGVPEDVFMRHLLVLLKERENGG